MISLTKDVGYGFTITVQGELLTNVFEQMAMAQDVFGRIPDNINDFQIRHREVDGNNYYEFYDPKTKAKLALGQYKKPKEGWLFPKRKDKDGNWLDNNGWEVWQGNKAAETEKPAADATGKKGKSKDTGF